MSIGREPAIWAIACIAGTLLAASPAAAQCQYEVTVIQGPDVCGILGPVLTFGAGLNENGAVVGRWNCPASKHDEAFVWTPDSGLTTLARPTGVSSAIATDISDDGVIVGTYIVTNVGFRGFVYKDGKFTELPPLPGGAWSGASAISNAGQVVGFRSIGEGVNPFNAFLWSAAGGFIDLGVMSGPNSAATDVNNNGQVVGWTGNGSSISEGFIWEDGRLTLLGPVPGGFTSIPGGNNDIRQVVGSGRFQRDGSSVVLVRPFLWDNGQMMDLPHLPGYDRCSAVDINNLRKVIGKCALSIDPNDRRAFLWQNGMINDLDDLVPAELGVLIERPKAINNSGQIVCDGKDAAGRLAAILLTPIERPLGDLDGDCHVRVPDLLSLLAAWGPCSPKLDCPADLNNDGTVNQLDLVLLIVNWE